MKSGLLSRLQAQLMNRMRYGCANKKLYHTWQKAKSVARLRMRAECGFFLRPYRCPYCGGWHLTSSRKLRVRRLP